MMPDTYLWELTNLLFFLMKVLWLIFFFIKLHDSVPALTFTTAVLKPKHNKKTQMWFYNQRPKQSITL